MLSKELKRISKSIKSIEIKRGERGFNLFYVLYAIILLGAILWLPIEKKPTQVDVERLKNRAIKAVDPLERLDFEDTYKDYVTF